MDLSLRSGSSPKSGDEGIVPIVRPVPRPPWSILWYQNLWSLANNPVGESLGLGGVVGNEENKRDSSSGSAPFPPPPQSLQHTHRLYRLSMATTFNSDRCYPASPPCHHHREYKEPPKDHQHHNQDEPDFKRIFDYPMGNNDNPEGEGEESEENENDNESETSDSIVVTTSTSDENGARSITVSQSDSNNATLLGHHHHHHGHRQATVVLDIACCDGPVQFKRVSNPNFAVTVEHNEVCTPANTTTTTTTHAMTLFIPTTGSKGQSSSSTTTNASSTSHASLSSSSPGRKHLQSPQHHHQSQPLDCENHQWTMNNPNRHNSPAHPVRGGNSPSPPAPPPPIASTLRTYLCIYCNQSFKSLFCYQKHKKRHLNPVSVDITTTIPSHSTSLREPSGGTGSSSKRAGSGTSSASLGAAQGERRLAGTNSSSSINTTATTTTGTFAIPPELTKAKTKDLNVQFFPCKKCGCKFPSYYFVHKHRKICH